jgi:hypothetical protein
MYKEKAKELKLMHTLLREHNNYKLKQEFLVIGALGQQHQLDHFYVGLNTQPSMLQMQYLEI